MVTAVNDHHLCNPESTTGCSRCSPLPSLHCCDMCDPEFFTPFRVQAPASTTFDDDSNASGSDDEVVELSKRKSTLKPLKVTEDVVTFRRALYAWRLETAEAKYGTHIVAIYGSHMVMSDAMIDCVITCAKAAKLPTVQHLVKETGWREDLANKYGESLLTVVRQRCDRKKTSTPNNNGENMNPVTGEVPSTSAATRVMHCSACGKPGHNRMAVFSFSPFVFFNLRFKAGLQNATRIKSRKVDPHPVISLHPSYHCIKHQRRRALCT